MAPRSKAASPWVPGARSGPVPPGTTSRAGRGTAATRHLRGAREAGRQAMQPTRRDAPERRPNAPQRRVQRQSSHHRLPCPSRHGACGYVPASTTGRKGDAPPQTTARHRCGRRDFRATGQRLPCGYRCRRAGQKGRQSLPHLPPPQSPPLCRLFQFRIRLPWPPRRPGHSVAGGR